MRTIRIVLPVILLALFLVQPTAASDERFAIRFGIVMLDATADSDILGDNISLGTGYGGEFDFEWYFIRVLGLEGSVLTAIDADVDENNSTVAGVTVTPITVGLNWHPVRNDRVDWYLGVVAGRIGYGDFKLDDNTDTATFSSESDTTWSAQTAIDIGVAKGGRWGINLGLKWLKADLPIGGNQVIQIDPIVLRAMGTFRW